MATILFHKLSRISTKGEPIGQEHQVQGSSALFMNLNLWGGRNGKVSEGLTDVQFGRAKSGSRSHQK